MASSNLDDNVQLIQIEFDALGQHVATTMGPQAKKRKISSVKNPSSINENRGSHETSPSTVIPIDLDKENVCLCDRKFDYNVISPLFLHKDLCSNFDLVSDGVYRVSTSDIRLSLDANNCLLLVQSKKLTRPAQKLLFSLAIPHLQPEFDLLWCEIYLLNLTSAKLARNNIAVKSHLQLDFDTKCSTIAISLSYKIGISFDIHKPSHLDVIDKINLLVDAYFKPSPIEYIEPVSEPVSPHLFYSFVSQETAKLPSVPQDFEIPELDTNLLRFQSKSVNWLLSKENVKYDYATNRCAKVPLIDTETSSLLERYIANDADIDLQELENKVYQILNKLCFGWDKVVKSGTVYFYNKYTAGIVPITSVCKQIITYSEDTEAQQFLPAQGLLAEEMGLGKTVEITALVLMNQRPTEEINEPMQIQNNLLSDFRTIVKAKTTLIIAPESILRQWVSEVENLAPSLAVTIYKGIGKYPKLDNNPALIAEYLRKFDMVFSTYSTISKELDYAKFTSRNRTTRNSVEKNNSYREYLERDSAINPSSSGSEVSETNVSNFESLSQISANLQKPKVANIRSNGKYEDTDYERALQDEINLAIKHNKIPEIYKRINYESPLMLTHFWRVVLDEVQMVSSKYSRAFQSAALIPRFHAWGVSGTPIKKHLTDLHSILEFLKYFPFYGDLGKKGWQNLVASREEFMKLWKRLAIRHTKAMVHEDIQLPPQSRVLLTIPFSPIEQDNYNQLYEECLSSICLDEDGNPTSADWAPSASVMMYMSSWLQKLRQICNNPQIGQLSITSKKYKKSYLHSAVNVIQKLNTLDSLLDDMLTKAYAEIADVERSIIQIYMEVGDFFEFIYLPQEALRFLRIGAKEAEKIIFRTNLSLERCLTEQKALTKEAKQTETEEKNKENWVNDPKLEKLEEKIRALRIRIRNWNIYLHKFYFLIASGYFQCYDEEYLEITKKKGIPVDELHLPAELFKLETFVNHNKTEEIADLQQLPLKTTYNSQIRDHPDIKDEKVRAETFSNMEKEYYSLAENVRRDILQSSIEAVTNAVKSRISSKSPFFEEKESPIDFGEVMYPKTSKKIFTKLPLIKLDDLSKYYTVKLKPVFVRLNMLVQELNNQAITINQWMSDLINILCRPLLTHNEDPNGLEYDQSIHDQDKASSYLTILGKTLIERNEFVIGTETSMKIAKVKFKKQKLDLEVEQKKINDIEFLTLLQDTQEKIRPQSKSSLMELLSEIKSLKLDTESDDTTTKAAKVGILEIIEEISTKLSTVFENQKLSLVLMQKELNGNCNHVFNVRIDYFKQLQQLSDSVRTSSFPLDRDHLEEGKILSKFSTTLGPLGTLEWRLDKSIGRYRYLTSLLVSKDATKKEIDDTLMCIICRSSITIGSLTQCGHKYCKDCLEQWLKNKKTCPMCKAPVVQSSVYNFTHNRPNLKANVMDEKVKSHNEKLFSIYRSMSKEIIDEIQSATLTNSYSTKVDMIVKQVLYLRSLDPKVQIVIFSQWQDMLYILGTAFKAADITFLGSYGTLTPEVGGGRRHKKYDSVEEFKNPSNSITCFLLNAKAQASGLTLVNATHIFLCEPLVNISLELQAISRIHRIGQTKPTTVWMFAIEDTVEESIVLMSTERRLEYIHGKNKQEEDNCESAVVEEKVLSEAESISLMNGGGIDTMVNRGAVQGEAVRNSDLWQAFFSNRKTTKPLKAE